MSKKRKEIDWEKIQFQLEQGKYSRVKVANLFGLTSNNIGWASRNGLLDRSKWNLKREIKEEHKKKISDKLKKAHFDGRHPGWTHVNVNQERMSYPEKVINSFINSNKLNEKYQIIQKLPIGKYFLDFAFIDLKLDLEVDGQTHFRDEIAIEHDRKRNEWLEINGWKIYRIKWIDFNKDKINEFEKFLLFLENVEKNTSVYYDISLIKIKKRTNTRKEYFEQVKLTYENKFKNKILDLINSNIDFSKFGWVEKASKFLNVRSQKVNGLMKRIVPDFYNEKCFKRKMKF